MTHVTVGRWGKNLAVRFPNGVASQAGLHEGEQVDIETEGDTIVIRRAAPHFTLSGMFAGKTPAEWRSLYANAYDWGPDVGREAIEE
jgi:antitoxin component of MazEF toxin-antitoxin module